MGIPASELILNADGSIYHLNILPEDLAPIVITVGDPDRVPMVSKYFDTVEIRKQRREFVTHTGILNGKRITAISTGIGPDNIDIVFNELDALVNIDLKTRQIRDQLRSLKIIRVGTSGSIQSDVDVDSFVMSEYGVGLDGVLHFYECEHVLETEMQQAFVTHMGWENKLWKPYIAACGSDLKDILWSPDIHKGCTITNIGFYGPQGRKLRLEVNDPEMNDKLSTFAFMGHRIVNLEMETSTMYGLSKLMGHQTVSMNCIIANRANGTFSSNARRSVDKLISYTLEKLTS